MQVALYIYGDRYINDSIPFTADTTLVTADNTLLTADATIIGGAEGFYNVAQRIELHNDEKISITSSIQDIADISKAKTDFSQSFTIPASKENNIIFKHWYENAIDGGFDQRIKYRGFIEIDTIPFRYGGFALSNVKFKDNKPETYTITFYGDAKSIKDILKEDKLSSLDFSDLNHSFVPSEVVDRIESDTDLVAYPLFANDRLYSYADATATDVTTNTGAIEWDSLFPAVSLATILQKIDDKYGLSFTGAFTNYVQFSKLWMLFKNTETLAVKAEPLKINFTSKDSELRNAEVNITTDEVGFSFRGGANQRRLKIRITPTDLGIPYAVQVYKNGTLHMAFDNLLGVTTSTFFDGTINSQNVNDKYLLYVASDLPMTFTSRLSYGIDSFIISDIYANATSQTSLSVINIGSYVPELKLVDLITGLIKAFNLVVIPNSATSFELIPLELYYNNGKFNDISKNIITDDFEIRKTSMYKNINFKFQNSENILNTKFNELFAPQRGFNYGDLTYEQIYSLESNTFTVDLPFENPIYERKSDSNFQTITFKKKDLNNYVPKAVLMYDNGLQSLTTPIKISTGSFVDISNYRRFSNDINNGGLLTLNWGEEVSQWFLDIASNGLYKRHYENYLGNVFNLKGRLVIVKAKFNPVELTSINLNDRIVIRDKKYTINKFSTDLTTGESSLELLTDYRSGEVPIGNRFSYSDFYEVGAVGGTIEVFVLMAGYDSVKPQVPAQSWISYDTTTTEYSDFITTVTIDENSTDENRTAFIKLEYGKDGVFEIIEIPILQSANVHFDSTTITFDNNIITFDNDGTAND